MYSPRAPHSDPVAGSRMTTRTAPTSDQIEKFMSLVSNHADAQSEAVQAGAAPGFGKAELGRPAMLARVGAVLEKGR